MTDTPERDGRKTRLVVAFFKAHQNTILMPPIGFLIALFYILVLHAPAGSGLSAMAIACFLGVYADRSNAARAEHLNVHPVDPQTGLPTATSSGEPVTFVITTTRPVAPDFETAMQYLETHPGWADRPTDPNPSMNAAISFIRGFEEAIDCDAHWGVMAKTALPDGRDGWLATANDDHWLGDVRWLTDELPGLLGALGIEITPAAERTLR